MKAEYKGRKLRIAIIGCGGIAQSHMSAFKNIDNAEVVAGCDIVQDRLDLMNEKWGIPKEALFIDGTQKPWLKMFKAMKGKIDAVLFAMHQATVQLPVKIGDVIVSDVAGTGVDLVATANM